MLWDNDANYDEDVLYQVEHTYLSQLCVSDGSLNWRDIDYAGVLWDISSGWDFDRDSEASWRSTKSSTGFEASGNCPGISHLSAPSFPIVLFTMQCKAATITMVTWEKMWLNLRISVIMRKPCLASWPRNCIYNLKMSDPKEHRHILRKSTISALLSILDIPRMWESKLIVCVYPLELKLSSTYKTLAIWKHLGLAGASCWTNHQWHRGQPEQKTADWTSGPTSYWSLEWYWWVCTAVPHPKITSLSNSLKYITLEAISNILE